MTQKKLIALIKHIHGKDIAVDIDGIICHSWARDDQGELDYRYSIPLFNNIRVVNALAEYNTITLFTARGKRTGKIDWTVFTIEQMMNWEVRYHHINFSKPHYDILIDDRAVNNVGDLVKSLYKMARP